MKAEYIDLNCHSYIDPPLTRLGSYLENGKIGIFPTDTVYGLGCNALDDDSIMKLFKLKSRNLSKPICVLISNLTMLQLLVDSISAEEQKLIDTFWPGPLTIIFKKKKEVSNILTSNLDTIGIRMPNNTVCLSLIEKACIPCATTSVNLSGNLPGTKVSDFQSTFRRYSRLYNRCW